MVPQLGSRESRRQTRSGIALIRRIAAKASLLSGTLREDVDDVCTTAGTLIGLGAGGSAQREFAKRAQELAAQGRDLGMTLDDLSDAQLCAHQLLVDLIDRH